MEQDFSWFRELVELSFGKDVRGDFFAPDNEVLHYVYQELRTNHETFKKMPFLKDIVGNHRLEVAKKNFKYIKNQEIGGVTITGTIFDITRQLQFFSVEGLILTEEDFANIERFLTTRKKGPYSLIFRLKPVKEPFNTKNRRIYEKKIHSYRVVRWPDTIVDENVLSEKLNQQVLNEYLLFWMYRTRGIKRSPLNQTPIFTEKGLVDIDFKPYRKSEEQVHNEYLGTTSTMPDLYAKDANAFEYVLNEHMIELYAVVVVSDELQIYGNYLGHVYTWISPFDPTLCFMMGIRSTGLMTFLRAQDKGVNRMSSHILDGVIQFARNKNATKIAITDPIGMMVDISLRSGFEKTKIDVQLLGLNDKGQTWYGSSYDCNCYVKKL